VVAGYGADAVIGLPDPFVTAFTKRHGAGPAEVAASIGAKNKALSTTVLPNPGAAPVVLVGLGDQPVDGLSTEELRAAAGAGLRTAGRLGEGDQARPGNVAIGFGRGEPDAVRAIGEGALLGQYSFQPVTTGDPKPTKINSISVLATSTDKTRLIAAEAAEIVAAAVVANREWVNQPPNLLYPETFAEDVRVQLSGTKINYEVLDENALTDGGYGGILAVGGGSQRPPRLVRLSYAPRGAKFHLGLVGKGITFDSGGLDIKSPAGMAIMKSDMSGAGAVLAATKAIAQLGLKIKITSYAALAENLPSGSAFRPSDVLTMYGGKTVENFNSDAEGRLVMADALVRLTEDGPDLIIDVATLTGACITALGDRTAGVMSNDDRTAEQVLAAARTAGEQLWQLPIVEEARSNLDSEVADLRSGRAGGSGGALTAAAFLREFVGEINWAHLDIAGPSFNTGSPYGYVPSGGTGMSVRTLITLAETLAR
jgi:leucyl aminopeptidase